MGSPARKTSSPRRAKPADVVHIVEARIKRFEKELFTNPMLDKLTRMVDERLAELHAREAGEPTNEQMEAREALFRKMLEHGPAPTEAEMVEAFGKWR